MTDHRLQFISVGTVGTARDTHHARLRGTIDISIEHADAQSRGRQAQSQVDRRRGFADATLAAGNRDNVLHARCQWGGFLRRASAMGMVVAMIVTVIVGMPTATLSRPSTLRTLRRQNRCHRQNAGHTAYRCFRRLAQRF